MFSQLTPRPTNPTREMMTGMNDDPALIAVAVLGAAIGAFPAFILGMFYARMQRAWTDRRGAKLGAKKAHKNAMSYIPASIRYAFGTLLALVLAFVVLLSTNDPQPAGPVPAAVPSSAPAKVAK